MADTDVTQRAKDILLRQIAGFESMAADLADLDRDMAGDEEALERLSRIQEAHHAKTLAMESEIQAILGEWTVARVSDVERREVRALSDKARQLAEHLITLQERGKQLADARLAALREGLDDVARGRDLLDRYGQGSQGLSSFIDTKA